jgi:myo-inositol-hexaphosphate 3-phosphohydrolase
MNSIKSFVSIVTIAMFSLPALAADDHKGHNHDKKEAAGAGKHAHTDSKPVHGGVVTTIKDMTYELVAKPESLTIYVMDHGKAVDLSKSTGKITLLSGTGKQDIDLQPVGNRLEAKGAFKVAAGTKAMAKIAIAGSSTNAVFVLK